MCGPGLPDPFKLTVFYDPGMSGLSWLHKTIKNIFLFFILKKPLYNKSIHVTLIYFPLKFNLKFYCAVQVLNPVFY